MRDSFKDLLYFDRFIEMGYLRINKFIEANKSGKTPSDRIQIVNRVIANNYLRIAIAKYSKGLPKAELLSDLVCSIEYTHLSWNDNYALVAAGDPSGSYYLPQYYLDNYDEILWMLSLGSLLNVPDSLFSKLVDVIDRGKVNDQIFEFIICARFPQRSPIVEESYTQFFAIPKVYEKLRLAIKEQDQDNAILLLREFLEKDWYKNHREAGWFDSHKSANYTFFGYWSFESAAVVKILNIDDNPLRECPYYPKDLV